MGKQEAAGPARGPDQQFLNNLWDEHVRDEFVTRDTGATLGTMVPAFNYPQLSVQPTPARPSIPLTLWATRSPGVIR